MQLDYQECKLSAHIRYVYVLGNVLVTYNLMLIALAYSTLAQPSCGRDTDPEEDVLMKEEEYGAVITKTITLILFIKDIYQALLLIIMQQAF